MEKEEGGYRSSYETTHYGTPIAHGRALYTLGGLEIQRQTFSGIFAIDLARELV